MRQFDMRQLDMRRFYTCDRRFDRPRHERSRSWRDHQLPLAVQVRQRLALDIHTCSQVRDARFHARFMRSFKTAHRITNTTIRQKIRKISMTALLSRTWRGCLRRH